MHHKCLVVNSLLKWLTSEPFILMTKRRQCEDCGEELGFSEGRDTNLCDSCYLDLIEEDDGLTQLTLLE